MIPGKGGREMAPIRHMRLLVPSRSSPLIQQIYIIGSHISGPVEERPLRCKNVENTGRHNSNPSLPMSGETFF